MAKVLAGSYVAAVAVLLAAAASLWHLRCEGFGCMGVGVAWMAWVIAFFAVWGLGLLARRQAASAVGLARVCRAVWWVHLGAGAALAVAWFTKNAV